MFLALLFLVAAFVVFFDLVQPAYNEEQTLRSQLIGETQSLSSEQALVAQAQNLINSYKNGSLAQDNVGVALPPGEDLAGALAQVEGIAQNDNVSITSIALSTPMLDAASTQTDTAGSVPQAVKPLGSFTVSLVGSASYENLKSFLTQIETNIRIFDIKSLSLAPAPVIAFAAAVGKNTASTSANIGSHDLFSYNISLQTYYQAP
jgi:hypothetical protein